ncbi:MAG: metallophosphoesterase [Chloroflexota bacterium]
MRILAVSDQVDERIYSVQVKQRFSDVELVIGCGDLPFEYLEFLVTALNVPLLYVPGNHDPVYHPDHPQAQAEGCIFLDQQLVRIKGISFAGMGGCVRYLPSGVNQYSQVEMYTRLFPLLPKLIWNWVRHRRRLDILVTHSPPRGVHDDDDQAHTGFSALRDFICLFKPRYHLHGHVLYYKSNLAPPVSRLGDTDVVNVFPYRVMDVE